VPSTRAKHAFVCRARIRVPRTQYFYYKFQSNLLRHASLRCEDIYVIEILQKLFSFYGREENSFGIILHQYWSITNYLTSFDLVIDRYVKWLSGFGIDNIFLSNLSDSCYSYWIIVHLFLYLWLKNLAIINKCNTEGN